MRLRIVRELASGGQHVPELVAALGVSQPLVSQHLRVLRGSRIVTARRQAREIEYTLTDDHVAHMVLDAIRNAARKPEPASRARGERAAGSPVRVTSPDEPMGEAAVARTETVNGGESARPRSG